MVFLSAKNRNLRLQSRKDGGRLTKNIEGETALRPLRPRSIVPLSFLRFPAQSERDDKPIHFFWQAKSEISTVESCAHLCKKAAGGSSVIGLTNTVNLGTLLAPAIVRSGRSVTIILRPPKRPRRGAPACTATCEKTMKPPVQDIRVLVVDDSPVSRKLLEHTLAAAPYTLVFAKDGSDALRLFAE